MSIFQQILTILKLYIMENNHKIILKWNWRFPDVASSTASSWRSFVGGSECNALAHSTSWIFSASWKLNRKMNEKLQRSSFIYLFLFLLIWSKKRALKDQLSNRIVNLIVKIKLSFLPFSTFQNFVSGDLVVQYHHLFTWLF